MCNIKEERNKSNYFQIYHKLHGEDIVVEYKHGLRYLDELDITGKDKVFHSFRHTFETMAVEKRIPAEYQNAICGWIDQGIVQRLYAHKKDMNIMLEELSKIEFPINRELNELKKKFMDSYIMRN